MLTRWSLAFVVLAAGCSGAESFLAADARPDADDALVNGRDGRVDDTGTTAVTDSAADTRSDTVSPADTGAEAASDAASDVRIDAPSDAMTTTADGASVGSDARMDAVVAETGTVLADTGPDAPGMDAVADDSTAAMDVVVTPPDAGCGAATQRCCTGATACATGLVCTGDGTCGTCAGTFTVCGSACVDTSTSVADCGGCGQPCAAGQLCSNGACVDPCVSPLTSCAGACVHVGEDPNHCTACGAPCVLANATAGCSASACTIVACDEGFGDCDGRANNGCEADLRSARANCGTCGHGCAAGGAGTASCTMGTCALSCPNGFGDCDSDITNGCETNLRVSPSHCSSCTIACPDGPGAMQAICAAGACGFSTCARGTADCNALAGDGCEVDTDTSLANCGACGSSCVLANAVTECAGGQCRLRSCADGYADCDGDPNNGCETNLLTDTGHCGRCGTSCPSPDGATVTCAAGSCAVVACAAGTADCDGRIGNGCEVDIASTTTDCGGCGSSCSFAHAGATCSSGACVMGACLGNNADCNANNADGCEVNTSSNRSACGACGNRCSLAHATPACTSGVCTIATCDAGFADCNGRRSDGCEIRLASSRLNCGACGVVCGTGTVCSAGACVSTCASGTTACSGSCASLSDDTSNCGACGNVCSVANGVAACVAGGCTVGSCSAGFGNCDGDASNGCETDLTGSNDNCGGCGTLCRVANGSGTCRAGQCVVTSCAARYANCDGQASNGCETRTDTNPSSCGACGRVCSVANGVAGCIGGTCTIDSCNSGHGDCNGVTDDGCENSLDSVTACGSCASRCPTNPHASPVCTSGQCGNHCNPDYGDCDGNKSNGCEDHTSADDSNCGRCGHHCGFDLRCDSGSCVL